MGWLRENVGTHSVDTNNGNVIVGNKPLLIYVTGLTPVTVELIKACFALGIDLTLMNYDTATDSYIPQGFNAYGMVLNLCY